MQIWILSVENIYIYIYIKKSKSTSAVFFRDQAGQSLISHHFLIFLSVCLRTQGWNSPVRFWNSVQLNPNPLKSNPKNVWSTKVAETARWAISEHGWTTPWDGQQCLTALNLVLSWQNNKTLHPRRLWEPHVPHSLKYSFASPSGGPFN